MSDNSNSTGSSGSSTNSWTLLSPEEGEMENLGPVDDGTESLGDVPSLSEEVAGSTAGIKPDEILVETVLSEEGLQVCQETSPEDYEGLIAAGSAGFIPIPPHFTPLPALDPDSQPPVIHDIMTSSPSDHIEHLGSPFVTNIASGVPLAIHVAEPPLGELGYESEPEAEVEAEPESDPSPPIPALDKPTDPEPVPRSSVTEAPVVMEDLVVKEAPVAMEASVVMATPFATEDPVPVDDPTPVAVPQDIVSPETLTPSDLLSQAADEGGPSAGRPMEAPAESPVPETVGPADAAVPAPSVEVEGVDEETELLPENEFLDEAGEAVGSEGPSSGFDHARGDTSSEDEGGLRRRHVPSFETRRRRTSDEDEEDEEVEFRMPDKTEEKRGFSMNKCIVGALVLLCLGSLFLSDDSDSADMNVGEQTEILPSDDSQGMKEMLDKLAQENQKISQLEATLQAQKEELDSALAAAAMKGDEKGTDDLEIDNTRMKDELSSLPVLKEELNMLRARVAELSQLTAIQETATTTDTPPGGRPVKSHLEAAEAQQGSDPKQGAGLKDQLQRQRVLLEESKKRLSVMKTERGNRKGVRDDVEKIQKRLSEHVERLAGKKPWESRSKGDRHDHGKKEDQRERRDGKRDHKHGRDGDVRDQDEEEKEARKEGRERKQHKHNSHKEAWRKHQGEWDRKKAERRMDREERRKQEPGPGPASEGGDQSTGHSCSQGNKHHHHHHPPGPARQRRQYDHESFWRHQGEKLRRKARPLSGCGGVESCAAAEALYPVELPEFEELLEGYLSKLEGCPAESREALRRLTAEFFQGGVFVHDRVPFGEFAEEVADILEDMADLLEGGEDEDDDALEEEMEEFEREALWKFSATA
ncbi:unnamed protein product [Gadus morhua 'NCC']